MLLLPNTLTHVFIIVMVMLLLVFPKPTNSTTSTITPKNAAVFFSSATLANGAFTQDMATTACVQASQGTSFCTGPLWPVVRFNTTYWNFAFTNAAANTNGALMGSDSMLFPYWLRPSLNATQTSSYELLPSNPFVNDIVPQNSFPGDATVTFWIGAGFQNTYDCLGFTSSSYYGATSSWLTGGVVQTEFLWTTSYMACSNSAKIVCACKLNLSFINTVPTTSCMLPSGFSNLVPWLTIKNGTDSASVTTNTTHSYTSTCNSFAVRQAAMISFVPPSVGEYTFNLSPSFNLSIASCDGTIISCDSTIIDFTSTNEVILIVKGVGMFTLTVKKISDVMKIVYPSLPMSSPSFTQVQAQFQCEAQDVVSSMCIAGSSFPMIATSSITSGGATAALNYLEQSFQGANISLGGNIVWYRGGLTTRASSFATIDATSGAQFWTYGKLDGTNIRFDPSITYYLQPCISNYAYMGSAGIDTNTFENTIPAFASSDKLAAESCYGPSLPVLCMCGAQHSIEVTLANANFVGCADIPVDMLASSRQLGSFEQGHEDFTVDLSYRNLACSLSSSTSSLLPVAGNFIMGFPWKISSALMSYRVTQIAFNTKQIPVFTILQCPEFLSDSTVAPTSLPPTTYTGSPTPYNPYGATPSPSTSAPTGLSCFMDTHSTVNAISEGHYFVVVVAAPDNETSGQISFRMEWSYDGFRGSGPDCLYISQYSDTSSDSSLTSVAISFPDASTRKNAKIFYGGVGTSYVVASLLGFWSEALYLNVAPNYVTKTINIAITSPYSTTSDTSLPTQLSYAAQMIFCSVTSTLMFWDGGDRRRRDAYSWWAIPASCGVALGTTSFVAEAAAYNSSTPTVTPPTGTPTCPDGELQLIIYVPIGYTLLAAGESGNTLMYSLQRTGSTSTDLQLLSGSPAPSISPTAYAELLRNEPWRRSPFGGDPTMPYVGFVMIWLVLSLCVIVPAFIGTIYSIRRGMQFVKNRQQQKVEEKTLQKNAALADVTNLVSPAYNDSRDELIAEADIAGVMFLDMTSIDSIDSRIYENNQQVNEKHTKRSTWAISWRWEGENVDDVANNVLRYAKTSGAQYCWIDRCCLPQNPGNFSIAKVLDASAVYDIYKVMIASLAPDFDKKFEYCDRVWCNIELFRALVKNHAAAGLKSVSPPVVAADKIQRVVLHILSLLEAGGADFQRGKAQFTSQKGAIITKDKIDLLLRDPKMTSPIIAYIHVKTGAPLTTEEVEYHQIPSLEVLQRRTPHPFYGLMSIHWGDVAWADMYRVGCVRRLNDFKCNPTSQSTDKPLAATLLLKSPKLVNLARQILLANKTSKAPQQLVVLENDTHYTFSTMDNEILLTELARVGLEIVGVVSATSIALAPINQAAHDGSFEVATSGALKAYLPPSRPTHLPYEPILKPIPMPNIAILSSGAIKISQTYRGWMLRIGELRQFAFRQQGDMPVTKIWLPDKSSASSFSDCGVEVLYDEWSVDGRWDAIPGYVACNVDEIFFQEERLVWLLWLVNSSELDWGLTMPNTLTAAQASVLQRALTVPNGPFYLRQQPSTSLGDVTQQNLGKFISTLERSPQFYTAAHYRESFLAMGVLTCPYLGTQEIGRVCTELKYFLLGERTLINLKIAVLEHNETLEWVINQMEAAELVSRYGFIIAGIDKTNGDLVYEVASAVSNEQKVMIRILCKGPNFPVRLKKMSSAQKRLAVPFDHMEQLVFNTRLMEGFKSEPLMDNPGFNLTGPGGRPWQISAWL